MPNPGSPKVSVFISYSEHNKAKAEEIEKRLKDNSVEVSQELEKATHFVLVWSVNASQSEKVADQYKLAQNAKLVIVPCCLDQTRFLDELQERKCIDFRDDSELAYSKLFDELGLVAVSKIAMKKSKKTEWKNILDVVARIADVVGVIGGIGWIFQDKIAELFPDIDNIFASGIIFILIFSLPIIFILIISPRKIWKAVEKEELTVEELKDEERARKQKNLLFWKLRFLSFIIIILILLFKDFSWPQFMETKSLDFKINGLSHDLPVVALINENNKNHKILNQLLPIEIEMTSNKDFVAIFRMQVGRYTLNDLKESVAKTDNKIPTQKVLWFRLPDSIELWNKKGDGDTVNLHFSILHEPDGFPLVKDSTVVARILLLERKSQQKSIEKEDISLSPECRSLIDTINQRFHNNWSFALLRPLENIADCPWEIDRTIMLNIETALYKNRMNDTELTNLLGMLSKIGGSKTAELLDQLANNNNKKNPFDKRTRNQMKGIALQIRQDALRSN